MAMALVRGEVLRLSSGCGSPFPQCEASASSAPPSRSSVFGQRLIHNFRGATGRRGCAALICISTNEGAVILNLVKSISSSQRPPSMNPTTEEVWWSDAARQLQPLWKKEHSLRVGKLSLSQDFSQSVSEDDSPMLEELLRWTNMVNSGAKKLFVAGFTQEMIIGRTAMLGFLAATTVEFETGKSVLQQLTFRGEIASVVVAVLVVALTLTLDKEPKDGSAIPFNPFGLFTPSAERLNGQAAMLGFVLLIAVESAKGSALF